MTVAISTSDSPDMVALGLSEGHFKEAMAEIALQLLAADTNLAYGGDLREHGFTHVLFQLVWRYTSTADLRTAERVTDHLALPFNRYPYLTLQFMPLRLAAWWFNIRF